MLLSSCLVVRRFVSGAQAIAGNKNKGKRPPAFRKKKKARQTTCHSNKESTPINSLRVQPFLIAPRRQGRFARRNVISGEEQGETAVFAG